MAHPDAAHGRVPDQASRQAQVGGRGGGVGELTLRDGAGERLEGEGLQQGAEELLGGGLVGAEEQEVQDA